MRHPYLLVKRVVLGANGTGTLSHIVPNTEKLIVDSIKVQSTGDFSFTDIRTTDGTHFTNASPSNTLPAEFFGEVDNQNNHVLRFSEPLVLSGGLTVYFDLVDDSGSNNTVVVVLNGIRDTR